MAMETRILGRTALEVCVIGLGTEHLPADRDNMDAVLDLAVSGGVNYVEFYSGSRVSEQLNRKIYARLSAKASDCSECEVCLERCPFDVGIIGKMRRAAEVFETTK